MKSLDYDVYSEEKCFGVIQEVKAKQQGPIGSDQRPSVVAPATGMDLNNGRFLVSLTFFYLFFNACQVLCSP